MGYAVLGLDSRICWGFEQNKLANAANVGIVRCILNDRVWVGLVEDKQQQGQRQRQMRACPPSDGAVSRVLG
jgi:hypothetical protein